MNGTKQVIRKELARVFGDKKLIFSLFLLPALLMIVLYTLMGSMMENMISDVKEHVPVIYIQNQPEGFDDYVRETGLTARIQYFTGSQTEVEEDGKIITKTMDDLKEGIVKGDIDLIVMFDDAFLNKINEYQKTGEIPEVRTYYNPSEDYSAEARTKMMEKVIEPFRQKLLSDKIGDLNSIKIFEVDKDPNASVIMDEEKAGGKMLAMMFPYLIVMLLFTGPMSLGVDAITGEKERGTLASMLITPLKRSQIVMGKLISLSILSCLSAVVYAASMVVAIPNVFGSMGGDNAASLSFSLTQIIELFIIMLALVFLYVNIVSLISVFARTAKEASSYISPIYILVIIAGVFTMFSGNSTVSLPMFMIPIYGSASAIQKLMTNELTILQFGTAVGSTLAVAFIITCLVTRAFNSEKVMFNA